MPETGNNKNIREKILSIRLSADGLSFWSNDAVSPDSYDTDGMVIFRDSGETETTVSFDPALSICDNVARVMLQIRSFNEALLQSPPEKKIVCIDTPKTVMVPAGIYKQGSALKYLSLHNLTVAPDEQVDVSKPVCGTVAVMCSNGHMLRCLGEQFGEFKVVSPLQYMLTLDVPEKNNIHNDKPRPVICIYNCPQRVYISVRMFSTGTAGLVYGDVMPVSGEADAVYYLNTLNKEFDISKCSIYITGFEKERLAKFIGGYYNSQDVICV